MFERLLISCPNHNGGLFLIDDKKVVRLDNLSSTGICFDDEICIRGFQSNGGLIGVNKNGSRCINWIPCPDVHDVMVDDGSIYVVETASNSIAQYDFQGRLIGKRSYNDKTDSWHINCLAKWNDRIIFAAFGEFDSQQGYQGNTNQSGFVQDLLTGERLITGLSQPHSPSAMGDDLLIANSETFEILRFSSSGALKQKVQLKGYARGICVAENAVYVGLSQSRNCENTQSDSAAVVSLDPYSLREVGWINLEADEIYMISQAASEVLLPDALARMSTVSTELLAKELKEAKREALALQQHLEQIRNSRPYKIARWMERLN